MITTTKCVRMKRRHQFVTLNDALLGFISVILLLVTGIVAVSQLSLADQELISPNNYQVMEMSQQRRNSLEWNLFDDRSKRDIAPGSAIVATGIPTSVCEALCNCTTEKGIFLNVVCDFIQNTKYILDEQITVPTDARTFHVNLGSHSQLFIRGKVFRQLNRISIEGGRAGRQQINFGERSFHDNAAPFPEINLRHVQTLTIHGNAFQGIFKLNVANVNNIIIEANAFQNTSFYANFSRIDNLRIEKDAFRGTSESQITVVNSHVGLLERVNAGMKEIKLQSCRIDAIKTNTFDVLSIQSIVLDNCDINVIESNFTTEKLQNDYLGIIGCRIGTISRNAIANNGFNRLEIEGNTIQNIDSDAVSANAAHFTFSNNVVLKTGNRWLTVQHWSSVMISNNSFGYLAQIAVLGPGDKCLFVRNSITKWMNASLATMAASCSFEDNVFSTECFCNFEWLNHIAPNNTQLRRSSYCEISNNLRLCFNTSTFNAESYHKLVCSESPALDCKSTMSERKVEGNFLDPNDFANFGQRRIEKYIYLVGGLLLIILLILITVIVVRVRCGKKVQRRGQASASLGELGELHTMSRHTTLTTTTGGVAAHKGIGTFSDHDRAIIDLAIDKLRLKYPKELFEHVDGYTRKLMTAPLSETEKVLTIGEIVRLLDECENIGDDFLNFTDILYRHLDNNSGQVQLLSDNTGESLYAAPGPQSGGGEMTPGATIVPSASENHIYAEPHSVQQPLLKMEYSLPLDRSQQVANIYADPVQTQQENSSINLVSPYAIGVPLNLPDVLSGSTTGITVSPSRKASSAFNTPKLKTFGGNSTIPQDVPQVPAVAGPSRPSVPLYSIPQKGTSALLQRDDSSSSSSHSTTNSNHSGGSDLTFKIDDMTDS